MEWRNLDLLKATDEAKFVIADRGDYEWSRDLVREQAARRPLHGALLAGPRRARAGRARPLDPRRRSARAPAGAAPQVPVAGRRARACGSRSRSSASAAGWTPRDRGPRRRASTGWRSCTRSYGQRTEAKERAMLPAAGRSLRRRAPPGGGLPAPPAIGGSSLTDAALPCAKATPVQGVIPTSYVPFRNAHLLSAAAVLGRGARRPRHLRRRSLGGLVGLPRLPARVLPGLRGGDPPRHAARDADLASSLP